MVFAASHLHACSVCCCLKLRGSFLVKAQLGQPEQATPWLSNQSPLFTYFNGALCLLVCTAKGARDVRSAGATNTSWPSDDVIYGCKVFLVGQGLIAPLLAGIHGGAFPLELLRQRAGFLLLGRQGLALLRQLLFQVLCAHIRLLDLPLRCHLLSDPTGALDSC